MKKLGALWLKSSEKEKQYFSGVLEDMRGDIPIVVFINKKKEKDNQPDYIVYLSELQEKKEGGYATAPAPVIQKPNSPSGVVQEPIQEKNDEIDVGNIPF